ncbi:gas vesicle protein [Nocardioides sp.]|uniref:gas vesicle protein n=1 Tax=Nocardioides sp. TaxID=35761 RepID=UPI002732D601|nr:gas vesicle protein [Nocardioides sp.]MDP3893129.1 gas vesicle protein [Nocardioides sp.]
MTTLQSEAGAAAPASGRDRVLGEIALVDLLDRLLGTGVVLSGDVVISLAGVDLVEVRLRALIRTIRRDDEAPDEPEGGGEGAWTSSGD